MINSRDDSYRWPKPNIDTQPAVIGGSTDGGWFPV